MKHAITLLLILTCASCATNQFAPELQTATSVDLTRYQGTWYEIARLPTWFQKECTQSKATYKLLESGDVAVRNECLTTTGKPKVAFGAASVVDKQTNAKLEVVFYNWFSRLFPFLTKGKYWILYLDTEYQTVIVGTPDRKYLWIMARTPQLEEEKYQRLVDRAQNLGFNTELLIKSNTIKY
jgi:apolipoprotein D and lipocalin family protein